jgi:hypothetical protein
MDVRFARADSAVKGSQGEELRVAHRDGGRQAAARSARAKAQGLALVLDADLAITDLGKARQQHLAGKTRQHAVTTGSRSSSLRHDGRSGSGIHDFLSPRAFEECGWESQNFKSGEVISA